ncbi:hypothetical protein [Actinomyces trachealis]|nr:hypothetical protein [Actinomyces trachealis]
MTTRLELVSKLITVSFLGDQRTKPVTPTFTVTFFDSSPLTCMLSI